MSDSKKIKYLSKTVAFGGKTLTLFSIDGQTWSSRKQELLDIKERQERDKVSFVAIKEENGETRVAPKAKGKPASPDSSYEEEDVVDFVAEEEFPKIDYSLDEEKAPKGRGKRGPKPALKVKQQVAPKKPLKPKLKEKKKPLKVAPKKRATSKPKVKPSKKAKRKAA